MAQLETRNAELEQRSALAATALEEARADSASKIARLGEARLVSLAFFLRTGLSSLFVAHC